MEIQIKAMGSGGSKEYIAKETYHPFPNEWEGFTSKRRNDPEAKVGRCNFGLVQINVIFCPWKWIYIFYTIKIAAAVHGMWSKAEDD